MVREYFCTGCGLFYWGSVGYTVCPDETCDGHTDIEIDIYPVDTLAFFYFSENNKEFIKEHRWSSLKYAPEFAVEIYRKQGIPIKEEGEQHE